jgi:hypothetical protein
MKIQADKVRTRTPFLVMDDIEGGQRPLGDGGGESTSAVGPLEGIPALKERWSLYKR